MKKDKRIRKTTKVEKSDLSLEKNNSQKDESDGVNGSKHLVNKKILNKEVRLLNDRQTQKLDVVNKTRSLGYYTFQRVLEYKSGPVVGIDGRTFKLLSSYDYQGLIGHSSIENAVHETVNTFGTSSGGVRLLTGTNSLHLQLEKELAEFIGAESALTFTSGYMANLAVLSVFDSKDLALIDSKIHKSTLDACKLAGLPFRRFEHNNPGSLDDLLKRDGKQGRRTLIISEGIFSMDGDICKLNEIVELKKKYRAFLMIDEAHSLGVLGKEGRGVASHCNVDPQDIDIFTGSLSKAIAASGGYVAGSSELALYLQHGSSPYIFSAALTPAATAAARESLNILKKDRQRSEKLWGNADFFRSKLKALGYNTGLSETPIVPVILGSDEATLRFARKLFDNGILATPVLFPAVPRQEGRLRLCVTAAQEKTFLDEVIEVFKNLKDV